jgi:hypothetical protein
MNKLLVLLPFLLLISVYAYDVECYNMTSKAVITCNMVDGWSHQTPISGAGYFIKFNYTIKTVQQNSLDFFSYNYNSSMGSGITWSNCSYYQSSPMLLDWWRCNPDRTLCVVEYDLTQQTYTGKVNTETNVYYSNDTYLASNRNHYLNNQGLKFWNNAPKGYYVIDNKACDSSVVDYRFMPIVVGFGGGDNVYIRLRPVPRIEINNPLNNSVQYQNFTVNISLGNLAMCSSPIVESEVYDDLGDTIDYQYNISVSDGYFVYDVESGYYGKPFFISSLLYCNGSLEDFDSNEFTISLQNTTSNAVNNSILKNIYNPLCFFTPLPETVCNVPTQDVYIYVNNSLYYNLNATNETSFCFRDRGLDGYVPVRFVTYCSDTKSLIEDKTLWINFQYQLKHLGQDFGGFLSGVMPSYTNFVIMFIIVGFIVMIFGAIFSSGVSVWK